LSSSVLQRPAQVCHGAGGEIHIFLTPNCIDLDQGAPNNPWRDLQTAAVSSPHGATISELKHQQSAFIGASSLLQKVHDEAPSGHFTLKWLLTSLRDQSYGALILLLSIVSAAPGISLVGGLLLLVPSIQMIAGRPVPIFPQWIETRLLPTDKLCRVLERAIPILKVVETVVRPRWPMPVGTTRSIVGLMVLLLTVRLLAFPFPASNVLPAVLLSFISLAYLEADGMILTLGFLAGLILLLIDAKILSDVAGKIMGKTGI
jgi:hypothetical protein